MSMRSGERLTSWLRPDIFRLPPAGRRGFRGEGMLLDVECGGGAAREPPSSGDNNLLISMLATAKKRTALRRRLKVFQWFPGEYLAHNTQRSGLWSRKVQPGAPQSAAQPFSHSNKRRGKGG